MRLVRGDLDEAWLVGMFGLRAMGALKLFASRYQERALAGLGRIVFRLF